MKHKKLNYIFLIIGFLLLTSGAFSQPVIIDKKVNFGFTKTDSRTINTIIIHSTYNNSGGNKYDVNLAIQQFSNYKVSSHYMIGRDGSIYRLVDENDIAYHAGKSILPNGCTAVNSCSIGIELINSTEDTPTPEQIKSLINLVNDIRSRYNIIYILRHSDIAPDRKTDPWNFDWKGFLQSIQKK